MVAAIPRPTTALNSRTCPSIADSSDRPIFSLANLAIARPIGCSLPSSARPTSVHHLVSLQSLEFQTDACEDSATVILPTVSVPVLSNTTLVTLVAVSRASPPLTRIPFSAPTPVPTMTAVGVDRPRAQGQAKTMTEMQSFMQTMNLPPEASFMKILGGFGRTCERIIHPTKVTTPRETTAGTKYPATMSAMR
ncbi:hypothetical protein ABW19_dt0205821 [Dactylella cylindrospora]|nr:hypothetical protein ABW19_dt0205821 [Dactylella cylindrospora]